MYKILFAIFATLARSATTVEPYDPFDSDFGFVINTTEPVATTQQLELKIACRILLKFWYILYEGRYKISQKLETLN